MQAQIIPSPQCHQKSSTACGLAIADAIYKEYFKLRYEKQSHEESVEELQNTLYLFPEQIERYLAMHESYVAPLRDDWMDLAELPPDQFHRWVQIQNGEKTDVPCDDIPF